MSSSVPQRTHDIQGIATSLNCYSILSISAVKEAVTWKSNRVFAMRYLKTCLPPDQGSEVWAP